MSTAAPHPPAETLETIRVGDMVTYDGQFYRVVASDRAGYVCTPIDGGGPQRKIKPDARGLQKVASPLPGTEPEPDGYSARNTPEILHLDPADVAPFGLQPREAFSAEDLEALAADIASRGQDTPVIVRKARKQLGKPFELIAGERRLRACAMAGVPVLAINRGEVDDGTALEIATAENAHRCDLNPIEAARNIDYLKSYDRSEKRIGELLGKSQEWVSQTWLLLRMPPAVQIAIKDGRLSRSQARALAPLLPWPKELLWLFNEAMSEELSSRAVEERARALKQRIEARQQPAIPLEPELPEEPEAEPEPEAEAPAEEARETGAEIDSVPETAAEPTDEAVDSGVRVIEAGGLEFVAISEEAVISAATEISGPAAEPAEEQPTVTCAA
ncbi:MAG TPA: ParB/RepB/Spo0J family partition protein, partial [Armatimonadota bacterium]|nr:ParB/RepB/Spo0J family partition protein [Armatimonadota bacterium]